MLEFLHNIYSNFLVLNYPKEWHVEMVKKFCNELDAYKEVCAPLLGMLELEDVLFILEDKNFPMVRFGIHNILWTLIMRV